MNEAESEVQSQELAAQELKEFQALKSPADCKAYWHAHPSIQARFSEVNFNFELNPQITQIIADQTAKKI
jgi:proteasome lid subunit RPN8/RPN11